MMDLNRILNQVFSLTNWKHLVSDPNMITFRITHISVHVSIFQLLEKKITKGKQPTIFPRYRTKQYYRSSIFCTASCILRSPKLIV